MVLSIHQISEDHGKHCVIERTWEVLGSVRKREVLSFKSEKVNFHEGTVSLSQKTTKQTTTNKQENRYSINF